MCGIYFTNKIIEKDEVHKKMNKISYRGPDNLSIKCINGNWLAHLRLSIQDLDKRSNQPFSYKHYHIIFNGEIYNFIDLKKTLFNKYDFITTSDTEVLLYLFIEYGFKCLNMLNGMFSFIIYNEIENTIFVARDRLGKKPLFYSIINNTIELSSQPSQLLNSFNANINYNSLNEFFAFKYIKEPFTIWDNIFKFPSGSYMFYDCNNFKYSINKFWDIVDNTKEFNGNYEDAKSELLLLLNDSVKIRNISDIPVGVNLSGGIDSSLIAILTKFHNFNLNTFSVKFNEAKFNESTYANQIANKISSNHNVVNFNINDILYYLDNYSNFFDEPFADSSSIPSLILSKHIKNTGISVTLSGDGADEIFSGYHRYGYISTFNKLSKLIPLSVRKSIHFLLNHNLTEFLANNDINKNYIRLLIGKYQNELVDFNSLNYDFTKFENSKSILDKFSKFDCENYLINDINVKLDRSMMANSVEARSPFQDYRIIEFGNSLPSNFKINKKILKDILKLYMPNDFIYRNKKGFTASFEILFKTQLKSYVIESLNKDNCYKYLNFLDYNIVKGILNDHFIKNINRYPDIFSLLVLRNFFKSNYSYS